jgi:hypothetical protein
LRTKSDTINKEINLKENRRILEDFGAFEKRSSFRYTNTASSNEKITATTIKMGCSKRIIGEKGL